MCFYGSSANNGRGRSRFQSLFFMFCIQSNLTSPEGVQPAPNRHQPPEPEPRRGVGGRINPPQDWGLGLVLVY